MDHNLTEADEYIPEDVVRLIHQSVTPEQYEELVYKHRDLRFELSSTGGLIIVPPAGLESGRRNANLTCKLVAWSRTEGGVCFGSTGIFALPNGARRIPDASWLRREKRDRLSKQQQDGFGPFCPDFVVEVRSPPDRVIQLRAKMMEYMENGARLGWLIDPFERRVYVYQSGHELVVLENPETVSGDPLLPGFKLNVTELWGPDLQDLQD